MMLEDGVSVHVLGYADINSGALWVEEFSVGA